MSGLTAEQHELVSMFVDIATGLNLEKANSRISLIQAGMTVLTGLEDIGRNQSSPWAQKLEKSFDSAISFLQTAAEIEPEIESDRNSLLAEDNPQDPNIDLFANAWTQYSESTFEHSVSLVGSRLKASGFDSTFFRDKTVFDGGCGTGRLSVLAARWGAKHVVSADIGGPSLEFLRDVVRQEGLSNVEVIEQDITDLSAWADSSFDFVASNGVLHHTAKAASGIREHWKKTRPGGGFLGLPLWGRGGLLGNLRPSSGRFPASFSRPNQRNLGAHEG